MAKHVGKIVGEFLGVARTHPGLLASYFSDQELLRKAAHSEDVTHDVDELWHDGNFHRSPSRHDLNTGRRGFSASGGTSPAAMNAEFSSNSRQRYGVQSSAEEFGSLIKANRFIKRARRILDRVDELIEKAERASGSKYHNLIQQARVLRAKAKKLLSKARTACYDAGSAGLKLRSDIRQLAKVAEITVVQEEEAEEEEEEEEAERDEADEEAEEEEEASKAARQIMADERENQRRWPDGDRDDRGREMKAVMDPLTAALTGYGVLEGGTVPGLMGAVIGSGRGVHPKDAAMIKAKLEAVDVALVKAIETATDSGMFSAADRATAMNLLGKIDAVRKGGYPVGWFQRDLQNAPSNIVSIFRQAA